MTRGTTILSYILFASLLSHFNPYLSSTPFLLHKYLTSPSLCICHDPFFSYLARPPTTPAFQSIPFALSATPNTFSLDASTPIPPLTLSPSTTYTPQITSRSLAEKNGGVWGGNNNNPGLGLQRGFSTPPSQVTFQTPPPATQHYVQPSNQSTLTSYGFGPQNNSGSVFGNGTSNGFQNTSTFTNPFQSQSQSPFQPQPQPSFNPSTQVPISSFSTTSPFQSNSGQSAFGSMERMGTRHTPYAPKVVRTSSLIHFISKSIPTSPISFHS